MRRRIRLVWSSRASSSTPRCPDCKSGPMFRPAHPWGRASWQSEGLGDCKNKHAADGAESLLSDRR
jgi:hypothetical protein